MANSFARGSLRSVYNSAMRSQRTRGEGDIQICESESLVYIIVTFVVFFFCVSVLGSVLEKVSFDCSGEKKEFNMIIS